jgi:hypothetical protein
MALDTGAKLGPYQLATSIGAGGMVEVYRAHDRRLDFGLAKLTFPETGIEDQTKTMGSDPGTVLGTVGYMSPEQVAGQGGRRALGPVRLRHRAI